MNAKRRDRLARLAVLLVTAIGVAACGSSGPAKVPAGGTVTYKGQPVASGQVQFRPEAAAPEGTEQYSATGPITDGKFVLGTEVDGDGAPPGKYKVGVFSYKEIKLRSGDSITKSAIPERYADAEVSGLSVEIPPEGKQDIKIELVD